MMVNPISLIVKFILMLNLNFSRPQMNHMVHMMHGIILCEGRKNISQIHNKTAQYRDLSCITRFLKESPLIAAVKANRTICSAGIRIKISQFAATDIQKSDLCSVTVENQGAYKIYPYEGPLADMENVKVLLSWENEFRSSKTPFCILCTDHSLDLVTILSYYQVRWNIETGYRYFKETLGFDQYQLQSFKAIGRFWAIQFLTYNFLELQRKEWSNERLTKTIGDVVRRIRVDALGQIVLYVYQQAQVQKPIIDILKALKLTA